MRSHRRTKTFDLRQLFVFGVTAILAVGGVALAAPARAQVDITVLHRFAGGPTDGCRGVVTVQGPDGMFYGFTGDPDLCRPSDAIGILKMAPDGSGYTVITGQPVVAAPRITARFLRWPPMEVTSRSCIASTAGQLAAGLEA